MANKTDENNNILIGKMLKKARENQGVTQADIAQAIGLSKNHVSAIERGVSKASIECLLGYCERLNMTPNDILLFPNSNIIPEFNLELSKVGEEQQKRVLNILRLVLAEFNENR